MYDVIIIGTGPAGLTSALYCARAQLKTLVVGDIKASNAYKAHLIENYFGFTEAIPGPQLMEQGLAQVKRFGAQHLEKLVVDIRVNDDGTFTVTDSERGEYPTKTVVISSGLGFKPSGIRRERELTGKGVSFCVTCDGFFFKQKNLAVVGSTDFAGEEALQLLSFSTHVTILSHGKEFTMNERMRAGLQERGITLEKTPKISQFVGEEKLEKIVFADGTERNLDGVFLALGVAGAGDFALKLGVERTGPQKAFIVANPRTGETNLPGLYAAGDCTGGNAQASKSSGEGCNAAMSVIKFVKGVAAYVDYA